MSEVTMLTRVVSLSELTVVSSGSAVYGLCVG